MQQLQLREMLGSMQMLYMLLVLGIILCLLTYILHWKVGRGDTVLLVGHNGAGKTTLLLQLEQRGACKGTVTSMKESVGVIKQEKIERQLRVVDVPGHPRISKDIFARHCDRAKAIVFLVDSIDFMVQKDQVAEHLYDVLASRTVSSRKVPVLLAANKVDCGAKAHSVEFIRKRLEKALDQLCVTRADVDAEGGEGKVLSKVERPFSFAGLAMYGSQVTTASCSALHGDVREVVHWLSQHS